MSGPSMMDRPLFLSPETLFRRFDAKYVGMENPVSRGVIHGSMQKIVAHAYPQGLTNLAPVLRSRSAAMIRLLVGPGS